MQRLLAVFLVGSFLLFCQSHRDEGSRVRELGATDAKDPTWFSSRGATFDAQATLKRVFLIFFKSREGRLAYGSGVAVSAHGRLLANFHVLEQCIESLGREQERVLHKPELCEGYFAVSAADIEDLAKETLEALAEARDYAGLVEALQRAEIRKHPLSIISHWAMEESLERGELSFDVVEAGIDHRLNEGAYFPVNEDRLRQASDLVGSAPVFSLGFSAPKTAPSLGFEYLKARYSVGTIQESVDEEVLFSGKPYVLSCAERDDQSFIDINFGGSGSAVMNQQGDLVGLHVGTWQGNCAKPTASVIIPLYNIYWRLLEGNEG